MDSTLTDDGIETRGVYQFKRLIWGFKAYKLLPESSISRFSVAVAEPTSAKFEAQAKAAGWQPKWPLGRPKMLQFYACHAFPRGCILYVLRTADAITCCSLGFTSCLRRC